MMPHAPMPPRLDAEPWLRDPALAAVLAAIAAGGQPARIVGGAVRNALIGRPVNDLDIATPARPEEVMRLAVAAGLQAIPTGIDHGTVTIVSRHRPFEVTTLRRDVETFGRHAHVVFTDDWREDAARRDFTINALYCDADGTVHDPLGGWPDLQARRVRFIGAAEERIREDYLRILRFFRFTAEYSADAPDPAGLAACMALAEGLDTLSGERIRAEMMKLLVAPRAVDVLEVMDRSGILRRVVGTGAEVATLARLVAIEDDVERQADPALRLAALAATTPAAARHLRTGLRLSNAEATVLSEAAELPPIAPSAAEHQDKIVLYRRGVADFERAVLLAWARSGDSARDPSWRRRLSLPARFERPVLPVRGADVLALGVPAGPAVGRIIAAFEDEWIRAGFPVSPAQNAAALAALVRRLTGNQDKRGH